MTPTPLQELLARFERERLDADQQYNDALTALDAALQRMPELPQPAPAYDRAWLVDLSTNGTFLNGQRVLAPTRLRDGDRFVIAHAAFRRIPASPSRMLG